MKYLKLAQLIFVLSAMTMWLGQGCGQGFKSENLASTDPQGQSATLDQGLPKDFSPKPETQTASMTYARQTLDSMISCTGIQTSDPAINAEFMKRKGSLSEYGYATQITGPMMMSAAAIAGEVCNKLINTERAISAGQRRIFTGVDFGRAPSSVGQAELRDVTRRLARSCWSRNETDEEFEAIQQAFSEAFGTQTAATQTRAGMLMVCTAMLSSLSGMEM